ncbi:MAG TPA: hypothetical protein VGB02_18480 [Pyrinomonadaceae bacterium]|jgi:hypothetical protein
MKVQFLDLKAGYLELKDEIDAASQRVLENNKSENNPFCTRNFLPVMS